MVKADIQSTNMYKIIAIMRGRGIGVMEGNHSINPCKTVTTPKFPKMPREPIEAVFKLIIGAVDSAKSQCTPDRVIRHSAPETVCPTGWLAIFSTRHSLIGIDLFKKLSCFLNKGSAVDVGVREFINYTIVPESRYLLTI